MVSCAVITRMILLLVASTTTAVGLFGHFDSEWREWRYWRDFKQEQSEVASIVPSNETSDAEKKQGFHNFCDDWEEKKFMFTELIDKTMPEIFSKYPKKDPPENCPNIILEYFFVAAAIASFVGVVVSLLMACRKDTKIIKFIDVTLHTILGLLILAGAIIFVISAEQAEDVWEYYQSFISLNNKVIQYINENNLLNGTSRFSTVDNPDFVMRYELKVTAAAFGILQAIFHLLLALAVLSTLTMGGERPRRNRNLPKESQTTQEAEEESDTSLDTHHKILPQNSIASLKNLLVPH